MDKHDLRTLYDLERDRDLVSMHLTMTGPPAINSDAVGYNTSGLECLIMVLRRILSNYLHRGHESLDQLRDKVETVNPVLASAWRTFFSDEKPSVKCSPPTLLELSMKRIMDRIAKDGSSFYDLVECPLMNETLWSRPEFVLHRPVLQEARGWAEETAESFAQHSTNPVSCITGFTSLQKVIDNKFGVKRKADGTSEIWCSNQPTFVRVLCVGDEPPSFSDLRSFTMPVGRIIRTQDGKVRYVEDKARLRYNLIAVVRLGINLGKEDLVHTYSTDGQFLRRSEPAPRCFNREWYMDEPGYPDFYLVYAHSENPPQANHPEYTESQPVPEVQLYSQTIALAARATNPGHASTSEEETTTAMTRVSTVKVDGEGGRRDRPPPNAPTGPRALRGHHDSQMRSHDDKHGCLTGANTIPVSNKRGW